MFRQPATRKLRLSLRELHNVVVPDNIRSAIDVLVAWMKYYEVEVEICFKHELR